MSGGGERACPGVRGGFQCKAWSLRCQSVTIIDVKGHFNVPLYVSARMYYAPRTEHRGRVSALLRHAMPPQIVNVLRVGEY